MSSSGYLKTGNFLTQRRETLKSQLVKHLYGHPFCPALAPESVPVINSQ
jgi:hypothetical protein